MRLLIAILVVYASSGWAEDITSPFEEFEYEPTPTVSAPKAAPRNTAPAVTTQEEIGLPDYDEPAPAPRYNPAQNRAQEQTRTQQGVQQQNRTQQPAGAQQGGSQTSNSQQSQPRSASTDPRDTVISRSTPSNQAPVGNQNPTYNSSNNPIPNYTPAVMNPSTPRPFPDEFYNVQEEANFIQPYHQGDEFHVYVDKSTQTVMFFIENRQFNKKIPIRLEGKKAHLVSTGGRFKQPPKKPNQPARDPYCGDTPNHDVKILEPTPDNMIADYVSKTFEMADGQGSPMPLAFRIHKGIFYHAALPSAEQDLGFNYSGDCVRMYSKTIRRLWSLALKYGKVYSHITGETKPIYWVNNSTNPEIKRPRGCVYYNGDGLGRRAVEVNLETGKISSDTKFNGAAVGHVIPALADYVQKFPVVYSPPFATGMSERASDMPLQELVDGTYQGSDYAFDTADSRSQDQYYQQQQDPRLRPPGSVPRGQAPQRARQPDPNCNLLTAFFGGCR